MEAQVVVARSDSGSDIGTSASLSGRSNRFVPLQYFPECTLYKKVEHPKFSFRFSKHLVKAYASTRNRFDINRSSRVRWR